MDRYGLTADHPRFTLDIDDNYVDTLPRASQPVALAMQLCEPWGMSYREVLAMDYGEFYEHMLIHKAVTYKRPWWSGAAGEHVLIMEQTTHRRATKPPRRNYHH